MSQKKIFIGLTNIASQFGDLSKALNKLGHETITAVNAGRNSIVHQPVDYDIIDKKHYYFRGVRPRSLQKFLYEKFGDPHTPVWKRAIKECDIFLFMWSSFKADHSDFAELKRLGKKVVSLQVGNDARHGPAAEQEYKMYGFDPIEWPDYINHDERLPSVLSLVRNAEKYCDLVFSRVDQAQLQMRPYYRWPMMVFPEIIEFNPTQREKRPVVVHAPTSSPVKGTKYVIATLERLKSEGVDFEFRLIENMPHEEAMKVYASSDIIVDQLLIPGAGKLSTEGMAMGKVVMSKMGYNIYPQNIYDDCPIVDVTRATFYDKLKELIADYPKRCDIAKRGRAYVEQNLNTNKFCKRVLDLLENPGSQPPDYHPDFFRKHFIPESEKHAALYNKWTDTLKECKWYKEYVEPGERAGLRF